MVDDLHALRAELARDPESLVFLRLGEMLRVAGEPDAAARVTLDGLHRHPHLADAHDLYARILADVGDLERAGDEWSTALSLAPRHGGAHKGLGFLAFRQRDFEAALEHLELALASDPSDPTVVQALHTVRQAFEDRMAAPPASASIGAARQAFGGLEGAEDGLLLVDPQGLVMAGRIAVGGVDQGEIVAAYLAGASQEAARTARLIGLGDWTAILAEGPAGHVHIAPPTPAALLLVRRDRSVPPGRLQIVAERAADAARSWLEEAAR
jgi:tetratricopeptide (TPR) repeat protein